MYELVVRTRSKHEIIFSLKLNSNKAIGKACFFIDAFDQLHLHLFKIDLPYQRQGHGKNLYQLVETYIRLKTQFRKIYLQSMHAAYPFWLKMGYRGVITFSDILIDMEKDLV